MRDAGRTDAVEDGRRAARVMRSGDPPASYGQIARALGVSRSTADRWANPEALEYDRIRSRKPGGRLAVRDAARLHELRDRARRRRPCRRCGARRDGDEECWRCRLVERHARTAERIVALLERGVAPSPTALRTADPTLRDEDVGLFVRQLGAVGWLDVPGASTADLADRAVVQGLADARPTALADLDPAARDAATVAAGCLVALRPRLRGG